MSDLFLAKIEPNSAAALPRYGHLLLISRYCPLLKYDLHQKHVLCQSGSRTCIPFRELRPVPHIVLGFGGLERSPSAYKGAVPHWCRFSEPTLSAEMRFLGTVAALPQSMADGAAVTAPATLTRGGACRGIFVAWDSPKTVSGRSIFADRSFLSTFPWGKYPVNISPPVKLSDN